MINRPSGGRADLFKRLITSPSLLSPSPPPLSLSLSLSFSTNFPFCVRLVLETCLFRMSMAFVVISYIAEKITPKDWLLPICMSRSTISINHSSLVIHIVKNCRTTHSSFLHLSEIISERAV